MDPIDILLSVGGIAAVITVFLMIAFIVRLMEEGDDDE